MSTVVANPRVLPTIASSGAAAASAGLVGVISARALGPTGQGAVTYAVTVAAIVALIAGAGTGIAVRRLSRLDDIASLAPVYVVLSTCMGVVTAGVAVAVVLVLPGGVRVEDWVPLAVYGATLTWSRQALDLVNALGRPASAALTLAGGSGVQAIAVILILASTSVTPSAVLWTFAGAAGLTTTCCLLVAGRSGLPLAPRWSTTAARRLLRAGVGVVGFSVGLVVIQRLDRIFLGVIDGAAATGLYAVAATVAEATRVVSTGAGQVLFHRASAGRRDDLRLARVYARVLGAQAVLLCVVGVSAPVLVPLVFGREYLGSVPILQVLLVAEFAFGALMLDSRMVMGMTSATALTLVGVVGVVVAVPAYVVAINLGGGVGAAIASCLVYAVVAALALLLRRRAARGSAHVGQESVPIVDGIT